VIYPRLLTACAIQGMKHGIAALRDAIQSPTVLERPELAVPFEEQLWAQRCLCPVQALRMVTAQDAGEGGKWKIIILT